MKKKIALLLFVSLWIIDLSAKSHNYINQQIILVVDQTIANNPRMLAMYEAISDWLRGNKPNVDSSSEIPQAFRFRPERDDISLFAFAMPGEDVVRIQGMNSSATASRLFEEFSSSVIKNRASFKRSKKSLDQFLKEDMRSLFNGNDPLCKKWFSNTSYRCTMSHYVYPTILRHIDTHTPTSEYILIIVSDFASGAFSEKDGNDAKILKDMMGVKFNEVKKLMNNIEKPFERIRFLKFDLASGNVTSSNLSQNQNNGVSAVGHTLKMGETVKMAPLSIMSDLSLNQKSYQGSIYNVNPVEIIYNKVENTTVNKIELSVRKKNEDSTLFCQVIADSNMAVQWYNPQRHIFKVEGQELELGSLSEGDTLLFSYNFYTISKDETGKELMPFVLRALRDVSIDDDVLASGNGLKNFIFTVLILLLGGFLYWLWTKRGEKRDVILDVNINPISKMRFMDVKEDDGLGLHVLDYDCWYIEVDGEGMPKNREEKIHVNGKVALKPKKFAKDYNVKVSYKIQDLDENYDFTFRPDGNNTNGSLKTIDTLYPAPQTQDGTFEFNAVSYVEPGVAPNFTGRENVLVMGVYIKVELVDKYGKTKQIIKENNYKYEFIAKQRIQNLDLWVAFDPGTSGSCVAFGRGGRPSSNNIHLALNKAIDASKKEIWQKIIPSKIRIHDSALTFRKIIEDIDSLQEIPADRRTGDYWFGISAQQRWGKNSFQSIKKLLGYANELTITRYDGQQITVKGKDLAFLLVKGLINHFVDFLRYNDNPDLQKICNTLLANDSFSPSRAIVAVPNNYTLIKIRDMVESVKRTQYFREVHYLYEAEGVLMSYFRQNWASLPVKGRLTFVVFDMGGATINASAFKIKVYQGEHKGNKYIDKVEVRTVSKVGYCVGGDDIDYALMKVIYDIPSVKEAVHKKGLSRRKHQEKYKTVILKNVEQLKIDIIEKYQAEKYGISMSNGNCVKDMDSFWTILWAWFNDNNMGRIELPVKPSEDDINFINSQKDGHSIMKKYVIDKVDDAVRELMNCKELIGQEVELIFSGRSSLYPGIETTVMGQIQSKCKCKNRWHGFDKNGTPVMDDEKVKTAVVEGACWYAMWRQYIVMKHDIVTSTFGYIDMKDDHDVFVPVIEKNTEFENGLKENEKEVLNPKLANVQFIQMLGTNYKEILDKDIRYKKNPIIEVTNNDIRGTLQKVKIIVDDKNNFSYELTIAGQDSLRGHYVAADTDIQDENSEAYVFAAINPETERTIENQQSGLG